MDYDEEQGFELKRPLINLHELSIEELKEHIVQLEHEIKKTQQILEEKMKARGGAEAFFKK